MKEIKMIQTKETMDEAFSSRKALIFKDSKICPISAQALGQFQKFVKTTDTDIELYMVDVIASRWLSREIEKKTGIIHQSPQVIYLEDGKPAWSLSHWGITLEGMRKNR